MKIFKKISLVDLIILFGVIVALFVGVCTAKNFRQTADKQIEATSQITFQVFLRGVTITGNEFPIKADSKTFITIRNVPYTELLVLDAMAQPRRIFAPNSRSLVLDPSQPNLFDAIVTITDVAKITKDGAVIGGNKIKMGLPVTLEGQNYKLHGTISDVRVSSGTDIKDEGANSNIG